MKEKPPPKYFEVDPPSGILLPGQKADVRVRFMPSEEVSAVNELEKQNKLNSAHLYALYTLLPATLH